MEGKSLEPRCAETCKQKRPLFKRPFFSSDEEVCYSASSLSKVRASASRTRSSMALTGTAIPRSFSADSLLDPRWNQLPTPDVVSEALVPSASSSGAISEPYTSIRPPRVQCPLQPYLRYPKTRVSSRCKKLQLGPKPSNSKTISEAELVTVGTGIYRMAFGSIPLV